MISEEYIASVFTIKNVAGIPTPVVICSDNESKAISDIELSIDLFVSNWID